MPKEAYSTLYDRVSKLQTKLHNGSNMYKLGVDISNILESAAESTYGTELEKAFSKLSKGGQYSAFGSTGYLGLIHKWIATPYGSNGLTELRLAKGGSSLINATYLQTLEEDAFTVEVVRDAHRFCSAMGIVEEASVNAVEQFMGFNLTYGMFWSHQGDLIRTDVLKWYNKYIEGDVRPFPWRPAHLQAFETMFGETLTNFLKPASVEDRRTAMADSEKAEEVDGDRVATSESDEQPDASFETMLADHMNKNA